MATTFDIIAEATALGAKASMGWDEGDDISPVMFEEQLKLLGETGGDKLLARRHVAAAMRGQAEHLLETADRLIDRAKRIRSDADRIDEGSLALAAALQEAAGIDRVQTPDGGWAKAAVRKSVTVDTPVDATLLPPEYQRVKTEADKTAINQALQAGEKIMGCALVENTKLSLAWSK
jgi:hypothetical protein